MAAGQSRWKCLCWCCAYRQVYHYQHLPQQLLRLATHWLWWILQPPHQVGLIIFIVLSSCLYQDNALFVSFSFVSAFQGL